MGRHPFGMTGGAVGNVGACVHWRTRDYLHTQPLGSLWWPAWCSGAAWHRGARAGSLLRCAPGFLRTRSRQSPQWGCRSRVDRAAALVRTIFGGNKRFARASWSSLASRPPAHGGKRQARWRRYVRCYVLAYSGRTVRSSSQRGRPLGSRARSAVAQLEGHWREPPSQQESRLLPTRGARPPPGCYCP